VVSRNPDERSFHIFYQIHYAQASVKGELPDNLIVVKDAQRLSVFKFAITVDVNLIIKIKLIIGLLLVM